MFCEMAIYKLLCLTVLCQKTQGNGIKVHSSYHPSIAFISFTFVQTTVHIPTKYLFMEADIEGYK